MNVIPALLVSVAIISSRAAELPELVIPEGTGVNIHFVTGHEKDLDLIAAAGFKFIRMDFSWSGTEREKGRYDWSGYEQLLANLEKRKIRALFILDYSNPLYEETITSKNPINGEQHKTTASPQHPESVAAFARWAGEAAKHFRGRQVVWEIWNEPNIHFWSPEPNVNQYGTLALAAAKAVRSNDPNATLIAPATSGFPWEFLEALFKTGVLEWLDGVSVHPYRDYRQAPETAVEDYKRLRELIERHAPAGKPKLPIISGEWGYATHTKGLPLQRQAAFCVRQQLVNVWAGIPLSIWYDWKNDGPDADEREHNFGTVTADLSPKPAYQALKTMTTELAGYRVANRIDLAYQQDYLLMCTNSAGGRKLAAWTAREPHRVEVPGLGLQRAADLRGIRGMGTTFPPQLESGKLILDLAELPHYIAIPKQQ